MDPRRPVAGAAPAVFASSRAPLVAVARCRRTDDYLESLRRAGAEPRLYDAGSFPGPDEWAAIDGIVLTGGPDVDPRLYGEDPDVTVTLMSPERDAFELDLVSRAIERDVPVLAICRGAQVLNVAAGGTLVQDIPGSIPQPLDHAISRPTWAIAHDVQVAEGSRLAALLNPDGIASTARVEVNSRHHQAVKRRGLDLVIVATSRDGVIEAIERPASRFCVGVQWHPENFWRTGEFDRLFRGFVGACQATRS